MQEQWDVIHSAHHNAATNMAIDETLLKWHSQEKIPPTIRFYGWKRPSLTVGLFQNVEKTINFAKINEHNCDFVRRLTGGSAVLHDNELTYSIIVNEKHPKIPSTVSEAYYVLSQGLLEGYRLLDIDADFAIPERDLLRNRSAVCFERPAIYEMVAGGKKISGNAQIRKDGVLLQHGSIPMSMNVDMLFDLFKFPSERMRIRQCESFSNKATSINQLTGRIHTFDMLEKAFLQGFEKSLAISTSPTKLDKEQLDHVDYLVKTKYCTDAWNMEKREC